MKCSDCENLGWTNDEGEPVWGWCYERRSFPDPDIDRSCPNFSLKRPSMLQQLQTENEMLKAKLNILKRKLIIIGQIPDKSIGIRFNMNEYSPSDVESLLTEIVVQTYMSYCDKYVTLDAFLDVLTRTVKGRVENLKARKGDNDGH